MGMVKLQKEDLTKIIETLEKFPTIDSLSIITEQSGVGQTLNILFDTHYNGVPGVFKVDLTDTSKW